jgi:HK97 family phage prohead protease
LSDDLHFGTLIDLKFADSAGAGVFTGYASTFGGGPDSYGDIVAPGAFAATLREHKASGTMPALLWAHDTSEPIGVWTDLSEDRIGLKAVGRLTLDVQRARDAHALMRDGALSISIGYRTRDAERQKDARVLKNVKLFEASLVPIPANTRAKILSVKASGAFDYRSPRAIEGLLREAGCSRLFAKTIISKGLNAALGVCDADERDDLAKFIRSQTNQLKKFSKG